MAGHEDTRTALFAGALAAETADLVVTVNLVELEDSKLGGLVPANKDEQKHMSNHASPPDVEHVHNVSCSPHQSPAHK